MNQNLNIILKFIDVLYYSVKFQVDANGLQNYPF